MKNAAAARTACPSRCNATGHPDGSILLLDVARLQVAFTRPAIIFRTPSMRRSGHRRFSAPKQNFQFCENSCQLDHPVRRKPIKFRPLYPPKAFGFKASKAPRTASGGTKSVFPDRV